VLLLSKLRRGGHLYYLASAEGPGGAGIEPAGQWLGRGSAGLALEGTVCAEDLEAVLGARHPGGGGVLSAGRGRVEVAGYDLTFCAPKSVSLLHALGPPEVAAAVRDGHERAVRAALGYVEDHALAVRRALPGAARVPMPAQGTPAAGFVHRTSRALDPHLHSHVVVANVGRGPEGRWSALDGRGLYAHRATAGALYQAQLRYELTSSLGVAWGPLEGGRADVAGIGAEARAEFSRRSAAVLAHLAEQGLLREGGVSRRAREVASAATRPPKDLAAGAEDLLGWWQERAKAVGLGPARLEAVLDRTARRSSMNEGLVAGEALGPSWPAGSGPGVLERAMVESLRAVRDLDQPFARRHLVRAWASSRPLGEPASAVGERVDRFLGSDAVREAGERPRLVAREAGVSERRHLLDERLLSLGPEGPRHDDEARRLEARRHEARQLEAQLARRGMRVDPGRGLERGRARHRGAGLERADDGLGLEW
jgi:conjugative relaxase-like TrwC/TraI family protein